MQKKNFRTYYQVRGDQLAFEQSKIALAEAEGMLDRLIKQTGPKIIKSLEANVRAIQVRQAHSGRFVQPRGTAAQADPKNIEHCIVRAPGEGIVVYVNQVDRVGHGDRSHRRRRHAQAGSADLQPA